jgi:hypothetical protein
VVLLPVLPPPLLPQAATPMATATTAQLDAANLILFEH